MSGITIADLRREGLLTINISGKHKSARLTHKGSWFSRSLAVAHSLTVIESFSGECEQVTKQA
jgi:hypothetical protein